MLWFRVQTALEKSISSVFKLLACSLKMTVLLLLPAVTGMNLLGDTVSILDSCKGTQRSYSQTRMKIMFYTPREASGGLVLSLNEPLLKLVHGQTEKSVLHPVIAM